MKKKYKNLFYYTWESEIPILDEEEWIERCENNIMHILNIFNDIDNILIELDELPYDYVKKFATLDNPYPKRKTQIRVYREN